MVRTLACVALTLGLGLAACNRATPAGGAGGGGAAGRTNVLIDHDGGVDDLVAMTLLMKSPAVRVQAITICPADSFLEPATRATQLFLDQLGGRNISIAQGHSQGENRFPDAWRRDASHVLEIPVLQSAHAPSANPVVPDDATNHLVALLSGSTKYVILETGPLTNISDALHSRPSIAKNITRIYVMGGAIRVKGNVEQAGRDGSAEWNIFNQPQAAADVIRSGVPITLVPLDATNNVPLTRDFLDRLKAQPSVASQLAAQSWESALAQNGGNSYYFWDTLTAAVLLDRSLATITNLNVKVMTTGESQGQTVEDPSGNLIEVALDANKERVEKLFLDLLGR